MSNIITIEGDKIKFVHNEVEINHITCNSIGNLVLKNGLITNLSIPINSSDAVNKSYVDNLINNISTNGINESYLTNTLNNYVTKLELNSYIDDNMINEDKTWSSNKISDQLDLKANINHTHTISEIDDIINFFDQNRSNIYEVDILDDRNSLNPKKGDIVKIKNISDNIGSSFIYNGNEWIELSIFPLIRSVNGKNGDVDLTTDDIREGNNLYYLDDRVSNHPIILTNVAHTEDLENPHRVTKEQIGLGNIKNIKCNLNETRQPNQNDDYTNGYVIGSRWCDISTKREFVCLDNTVSSSVWKETTISTLIGSNIGNNTGTEGIGIYKGLNGNILEFKKLNPATPNIFIIDDINNDTVDIGIIESNITLQNLSGVLPLSKGGLGMNNIESGKFLHGGGNQLLLEKDVPLGDVVGTIDSQILENKTLDGNKNTVTNLTDNSIKLGANIDASKLVDGSISSTDFLTLGGIRSNIQDQIDDHNNRRDNPHYVTKTQVGLGNVLNLKNNYRATTNPRLFNDSLLGYNIGSRWIDKEHQKEYVCIDNTLNNAIWVQTSNDPGEVNYGFNLGSGEGIYSGKLNTNLNFKSLVSGNNISLNSTTEEITLNSNDTYSFILSSVRIDAIDINFDSILYFPWKHSEFSNFKNGKIIFRVEIDNRILDIRAINSADNSILGQLEDINLTGSYCFNIANLPSDGVIEIQIKKSVIGGFDPRIYGTVLKFDK